MGRVVKVKNIGAFLLPLTKTNARTKNDISETGIMMHCIVEVVKKKFKIFWVYKRIEQLPVRGCAKVERELCVNSRFGIRIT